MQETFERPLDESTDQLEDDLEENIGNESTFTAHDIHVQKHLCL